MRSSWNRSQLPAAPSRGSRRRRSSSSSVAGRWARGSASTAGRSSTGVARRTSTRRPASRLVSRCSCAARAAHGWFPRGNRTHSRATAGVTSPTRSSASTSTCSASSNCTRRQTHVLCRSSRAAISVCVRPGCRCSSCTISASSIWVRPQPPQLLARIAAAAATASSPTTCTSTSRSPRATAPRTRLKPSTSTSASRATRSDARTGMYRPRSTCCRTRDSRAGDPSRSRSSRKSRRSRATGSTRPSVRVVPPPVTPAAGRAPSGGHATWLGTGKTAEVTAMHLRV
jgi:hypothetical protein